jgi:threonine dehydratase
MAAIRDLGADLRVAGKDLAEANEEAKRIAAAERLHYVEDGEDRNVLLGCSTLAMEIVEDLPDFDRLIVPVGGGNLIAACALVTRALRSDAVVTGVQSEAAPAVYESWRAGKPLVLDRCATFAGGIATTYPGQLTFPFLRDGVAEMVLVGEEAIQEAAIVMLAETGVLPEGAAAAPLAALLADPDRFAGKKVVLLLTGSNFESAIWERLTSAGSRGR